MYGIVLAVALTSGASAPELFFRGHGCCGYSCHGCSGYSCHGCSGYNCHGCHGCSGYNYVGYHGCSGCYGCYGCYGCSGCSGCCGYSGCHGYLAAVPVNAYPACVGCGGYAAAYPSGHATQNPMMNHADEGVSTMAPATVLIKAAQDLEVKVDGKATTRKTVETTFTTPILAGDKMYTYVFTAEKTIDGEKKTETKEVTVRAGKQTVVDFTKFGAKADSTTTETAKVTVILPGEGKLFVNEVEMAIKGKQTFETPKLNPGQRYFYTVKADLVKGGKTTSETRRIDIMAGKSVTVDFSPSPVTTASR